MLLSEKEREKKSDFLIKVLAISDNSDFFGGGIPQFFGRHFSSSFTLISAHTNVHDPRTNPSGRKVIRRREKWKERGGEKNNEFSGHFVCHAARLQRRTGSARTSLGPKIQLVEHRKI
jgi:hypothetical protein